MKRISFRFFIVLFSTLFFSSVKAQINVNTSATVTQMMNTILGTGVTTSNVQLVCASGAYGTFSNGSSTNLNLNSGILLTTGDASAVNGPSSNFSSWDNFMGGNALLTGIAGATTYDECRLEFDVIPTCSNLQVNYVFGSEEYPEYVNAGYNDAFGFFISGPNPGGGSYTNLNIATVPGVGSPVTIDNINSSANSAYYVDNTFGGSIVYDGFTTPLTASVNVTPCQSYHMIIVIADGGDPAFDSGVFLSYQGVTCPTATVAVSSSGSTICAGQSTTLNASGMSGYTWNPGGMTGSSVTVSPSSTTTYTVTGTSGLCNSDTGTVTVLVNPIPSAFASNGGPYCAGSTISLSSSGGGTYQWSGPNGFSSSVQNPTIGSATTANSGTYTVSVTSAGCSSTATTFVTVNNTPVASSSNSGPYCSGQTISLSSSGGTTYSWSGPNGFSSSTQSPSIGSSSTAMSGVYTVTVSNGSCSSTSTTNVTVNASPVATSSNGGPYCTGNTVSLFGGGGGTYSWSGPNGFSSSLQNPTIGSATTANSGTYTLTVTSAGCSSISTTAVSVSTTPVATSSNLGPYCSGQTISLSSSGGGTYSWSGPAGFSSSSQNPSIGSSTTAMSGIYTVTVSVGTCTSTSSTNVTVNASPVAAASNSGPYCAGSTITLSSSGGGTYTWSGPSSFSSTSQNPSIGSSTTAMSGIYTVIVTIGTCTSTATTNVSVSTAPVATSSNSGPYCSGQSINLSSSGGGTYSWTGPGGFVSSSQNPSIGSSTTAMSGVYSVTVAIGTCTSTASTNVTVNQSPVAAASNAGPYCAGSTISLTSSGGGTYSWSGPNAFSSTSQNPTIASATTAMSGTYTITVTSAGCNSTATTAVTVNPAPTPASSNTGPYCAGQTINLTSSGGTNYNWSGPSGYTSSTQNPSITSSTTAMSGTYTVTAIVGSCSATATTNVVVNPAPVATASNTGPYCFGAQVDLSAVGGGTYSWSGPNGFTSTSQNPSIPNSTAAETGAYTVTVTIGTCTSVATTNVNVGVLLAGVNAGGAVCEGDQINLSCSNGITWSWTGPGGFTSSVQNPVLTPATPANSGTYSVSITDAQGCSANGTVNISVNPLPVVTATTSPVCSGSNATLTASGAANYAWSAGTTPASGASVSANPTSTTTYTVTGTDANGCVNSATITLNIFPLPAVTVNSLAICYSSSGILLSGGAQNYTWSSGTTPLSGDQDSVSVNPSSTTSYTVTGTDANGCADTATALVTVNPLPVVNATGSDTICSAASATLNANGAINYNWLPGNLSGSSVTVSPAGSATYTVTGTDANGCSDTSSVYIEVAPAMIITPATTNASCGGQCNGSASVSVTPASGPFSNYTYQWSNSATTASAGNSLCPGTYSVVVTDGAGCSSINNLSVSTPSVMNTTINSTDVACNGGNNGSATVNISGGTPNYIVSWSNGGTGVSQNNLSAGIYTVTISDSNLCITTTTVTINEPTAIVVSVTTGTITCISPAATITSTVTGGVSSYTYAWAPSGSGANPTGLAAGTYTLTVTDANGCVATQTTTVTADNAAPDVNAGSNDTLGCGAGASLNINGSSATAGVTYNWTGPNGFTSNTQAAVITDAGNYVLTVMNSANGCTASDTIQIDLGNIVAAFTLTPSTGFAPLDVSFTNTSINATSYIWSFGNGTSSLSVDDTSTYTAAGTYTVALIAMNSFGCADTTIATVIVEDNAELEIPNVFSPNGDGINDIFFVKSSGLKEMHVDIFNRWGERVAEIIAVNGSWDGKTSAGSASADGTYFYMLDAKGYDGKEISKQGYVLLTR